MGPATSNANAGAPTPNSPDAWADDAAIVKSAQDAYSRGYEFERKNHDLAMDDLQMAAGRQWDSKDEQERKRYKRPVLTDNRLPVFVKQVTGEVRRNRPSIKCSPGDGEASPDTAQVFEGMIRHIERISGAQKIYSMIVQSTALCGIGHMRLGLVYANEENFDLELKLRLIKNPFSVVWDPDSQDSHGGDAKWCMVVSELDEKAFKENYPEAGSGGWAKAQPIAGSIAWKTGATVTVAEYWVVKMEPVELTRLVQDRPFQDEFGQWVQPSGAESILEAADPDLLQEAQAQGWSVMQTRQAYRKRVCMYLLGGNKVLAGPIEWPGQRIPIFTCVGEEIHVGDETVRHGLVRFAKDAQRRLNLAISSDAEMTMMAPAAPYLVEDKMIAGYEDEWVRAQRQPTSYLRYAAGQNGAKPERQDPIQQNPGLQAMALGAIESIKATMGIFDASIGAKSRETSGVAIEARDAQADTGTYVYIDELHTMIEALGQEIVNVIPKVYSGRKMAAVLGEDDRPGIMNLERLRAEGRGLEIGKYLVICSPGPSYQTQRDKENDLYAKMADIMDPPFKPIFAKRLVRNLNANDADEIVGEIEAVGQMIGAFPQPAPPPGMAPPGMPPGMPGAPPGMPPGAPPMPPQGPPPALDPFERLARRQPPPGVLDNIQFPPMPAPARRERVAPQAVPAGRAGMMGAAF